MPVADMKVIMQAYRPMITVLGLGNLLQRDEGFGIHVLRALQTRLLRMDGVQCLDGGALGLSLLPLVEDSSCLLVLDAIDAGKPTGTLIELSGDQVPLSSTQKLSEHQVGFQEVLALARFRGRLPERLHLIGAQPEDLSIGLELSPPLHAAIPRVVRRAEMVIRAWN